eukprot:6455579-Alexandrium_andersonii.AAC.1
MALDELDIQPGHVVWSPGARCPALHDGVPEVLRLGGWYSQVATCLLGDFRGVLSVGGPLSVR